MSCSGSSILEACGSSVRLGKTASKILERPWCSCQIDASPFTGLYVTLRFNYLLFGLCRVDFIYRVLVGWGLPLQFMVHIPRIKFCNLYQIGFVTCTATQDFILWHLWSICSNWNKFNSLNEFVLLCLSSCGCLVRQLTMRRRRLDLEFQWCGANSSWKYGGRQSVCVCGFRLAW